MRRKLFNKSQLRHVAAVGTLLLATSVARAQDAAQAQMWAATARYVYADDPNLKSLAAKLSTEMGQPKTLGEFEQKLRAAVAEAATASKTPNISVLQRQFQNMRGRNAAELSMSLADSLGKMPARKQGDRKQKLSTLENQLMTLAQSKSDAAATATAAPEAAVPTEPATATNAPYPQYGPPAEPATSPLLWAALAMSGLSLLGVIRLLSSRSSRRSSSPSEGSHNSHSHASRRELSPEQHREVEGMIAKALAGWTDKPVPAASPIPLQPLARQASTPTVKQKLASNSLKTVRPPVEASPATLPPLASLAPDTSAPAAPAATPAEPAPAPAAVVEPGTSIELDVASAAVPTEAAPRLQFVNEAPFNNVFAARTLSDTLAPYSIYEVLCREQTPDQGQFRVVGNMVSHISNHRNILEPVCEYLAYPQGGETRIITEQPGEVRRRGDDWEVVHRARIRFE